MRKVLPNVGLSLKDVEERLQWAKPQLALYIGGMGAKDANFHLDVFARMGYEAEAAKIQELYLAGKKEEAAPPAAASASISSSTVRGFSGK